MLPAFQDLRVRAKLSLLVGLFVAGFVLFAVVTLQTVSKVKVNGPYYQRIVQGKDLIADILPPPNYLVESHLVVLQILGETDPAARDA